MFSNHLADIERNVYVKVEFMNEVFCPSHPPERLYRWEPDDQTSP